MSESSAAEIEEKPLSGLPQWLAAMDKATEEAGYFVGVGAEHWALFCDEGTTLIVSFETRAAVMARADQMPLGHGFAKAHGWSSLTLIADGETWFRDAAVYAFFDRQVDDAFFEDFVQVLFYGAGMAGYAACAYSVSAPAAQVLAINPRATLDPSLTNWDTRSLSARRLDFTSRYGYAPDMLEGAAQAVVVHDPAVAAEAMHAALFRAPYITRLAARHLGDAMEQSLWQMGVLPVMVAMTMAGTLTTAAFAKLWRNRRSHAPYLRAILGCAEATGRKRHEVMICRSVTKRLHAPRFAKRLAKLLEKSSETIG